MKLDYRVRGAALAFLLLRISSRFELLARAGEGLKRGCLGGGGGGGGGKKIEFIRVRIALYFAFVFVFASRRVLLVYFWSIDCLGKRQLSSLVIVIWNAANSK